MPILPAEPDFYPPDLWEYRGRSTPPGRGGVWWCLHAKPRQEKATGARAAQAGTHVLPAPGLKEDRTPQGRKIRSVIPLLPGYLFLLGDHNDRLCRIRGQPPRQRARSQRPGVPRARPPADPHDAQLGTAGRARTDRPRSGSRVRITRARSPGIEGTVIRRGQARPVRGRRPVPRPGGDRGPRGLAGRADPGTLSRPAEARRHHGAFPSPWHRRQPRRVGDRPKAQPRASPPRRAQHLPRSLLAASANRRDLLSRSSGS